MAEPTPKRDLDAPVSEKRPLRGAWRPPLWGVILLPFLVLLMLQGGLTAWLSLATGRHAVEDVGAHLRHELTNRVRDYLRGLLEKPHLINALNDDLLTRRLDPNDPQLLGQHFGRQLEVFGTASYIFFGTPEGGAAGAGRRDDGTPTVDHTDLHPTRGLVAGTRREYRATADGLPGELIDATPGFDSRLRPWYVAAATVGEATWSEVYPLFIDQSLAVAASRPVYDDQGELLGVLGVDLRLSGIGDFLRQLEIGQSGAAFVIDRNGLLIASSVDESPVLGSQPTTRGQDATLERRHGVASTSEQISGATRYLLHQVGDLGTLDRERQMSFGLGGVRQLLQVAPLRDGRGIDWLIVTVMPESDFTAPLEESWRRTLLIVLGVFALATLLGLLTARWIARPIQQLGNATRALAEGDSVVLPGGTRVVEVDQLSQGFERMAGRLRSSFAELEQRVAARTNELAQAKEVAEDANRAKTRFLSNVSHEIRTPLATILGTLELLGDPRLRPGERDEALDGARRQGHHLSLLLADLIDVGRIEEGQFELDLATLDLEELLTTLQDTFGDNARERGLGLAIETRGRLPWRFVGDARRLRQVLFNLLSNALRYTREGRVRLEIALARSAPTNGDSTTLELVVEDTGPGIAEDQRRWLFEPFTRLDDDGQGFGLGLAIVRQLSEQLGADLDLESHVGQGSRFTVRMPVSGCQRWSEEAPERRPLATRQPFASDLPALEGRVLVAEDSQALNQLCRRMLERWGLTAEKAMDGVEAVERVRRGGIDVVLMDWQMPRRGGLEATRELRGEGIQVPIIALTAAARPGDRTRCLEAGCNVHLAKPIDFRRLHHHLAQLLPSIAAADGPPRGEVGPVAEVELAASSGLEADPELAELVARFLERLPPQVAELEAHLASGEHDAAKTLCHRLVGSAGSFGLDAVALAAERLEDAILASTTPPRELQTLAEKLKARVEASLVEWPADRAEIHPTTDLGGEAR